MDVLSGTYILPIVKMDISKYTQTFIKDHHNNMQVMIGKVSLKQVRYDVCNRNFISIDEDLDCLWTNLGKFRYQQYESVYVTLMIVYIF